MAAGLIEVASPRRRSRARNIVLWTGLALANAVAADDALDDQGMRERLAVCATCHGERGEGHADPDAYYPHLAGKPAGYLLEQLRAFRDGLRRAPQMVWLTRNQSDPWLAEIADWYSHQPPRQHFVAPFRQSAEAIARAETLVRDGDAARDVPGCIACHGANLQGLAPAVPGLRGLPADYVSAQLGGWRSGVRASRDPDCMGRIARALSPDDLRALADWLSAQPLTAADMPAPAGSWVLPERCGSVEVLP